jgi:uncharacterized protein YndB with AHSA1/START domain
MTPDNAHAAAAAPAPAVAAPSAAAGAAAAETPSLMVRRRIKTPPAKVYDAWTRPEQLAKWWGPAGSVFGSADLDVRVGGRFFIRFATPDGEQHGVGGGYRDVAPGERLVFDWAWQSTPERLSLVTLRFMPDGDGTLFTLVHEQFFDERARDGHARGWAVSLDRLAAHCEAAG